MLHAKFQIKQICLNFASPQNVKKLTWINCNTVKLRKNPMNSRIIFLFISTAKVPIRMMVFIYYGWYNPLRHDNGI